jgi:hypothetical protein
MEKGSKHEALVKAATLVVSSKPLPPTPTRAITADDLATEAILTMVFTYYRTGLPRTKKAEYW